MGSFLEHNYNLASELKDSYVKREIKNPKVSIIVPAYNTEEYIKACLFSLIKQTLKEIEIIIVDDGSTDNTYSIAGVFASYDKRIKILTQPNQKQGAARNRGLEIAKGEYIAFVDSDDIIELNYCEEMYNTAKKHDADIAICSMRREKGKKYKYFLHITNEKAYTNIEDIVQITKMQWQVCAKLFRKSIATKIHFPEGIYFEDDCYTIRFLKTSKKLVTVPTTFYHYISNPFSTLKRKHPTISLDRSEASLNIIKFAKENNINIPERLITKETKGLIKIKHFIERKDYYFCGIKFLSKNVPFNNSKTFLVFNTACFGDVLLCNSLIQNIKNIYPNSKVVFICDKPFADAAKYQEGVDEVVLYDKNNIHKGVWGMLKFIKNFPYKKPFASFITYKNLRNCFLSKIFNARYVFNGSNDIGVKMQFRHALMLKNISNKEIKNLPIKFNVPENINKYFKEIFNKNKKYIALCMTSKKNEKDMPIEIGAELIENLALKGYEIIFTGKGEKAKKYAEYFKNIGLDFINLVNKTSIIELGHVLKMCDCLISVDTGTLHLGCSVNTPVVAIFYNPNSAKSWAPNINIYKCSIIKSNKTPQKIIEECIKLIVRK